MPQVTVTVRAGDPISETGVVTALRRRPEIRLVAAGPRPGHGDALGDGPAAVAVVVTHAVDATTLRLLAGLRHQGTHRAVLVASAVSDRDLPAAVEAGVVGVVRRSEATPDRLVGAVLVAAAGAAGATTVATRSRLAPRELDVLRLVADGFDTAQIAQRLCWSERTVKNVVHGVTTRLQLRNRSHAVAYAVREGLI